MASAAAAERARDQVGRICASGADARTLRLQVLAELGRVVAFDAYAWVLTDPRTSVGSAPLADVPCLPELPRLIRLRYLTELNRWTALVDPPVGLLGRTTQGDLVRSLLWRDLLRRYDVRDVATVVFRDRHGCWAFLELWRTGRGAFGPDDVAFLEQLVPPVTSGLRRSVAETFQAPLPGLSAPAGPLVLLLSPSLEVARQTPGTTGALRLLVPRDDEAPPVPAGAYNVGAQLLAVEAGVDSSPPTARVHLAGGVWLTLRAARLGSEGPPAGRDIAVTIAESTPGERLDLLVRSAGLSQREGELLGHLAEGRDTREVAERMFLSVHTVQDHLKSVFGKTGIRSRRALLSSVRGG
jgi:DNA-binding CsgD family transcriptional regulator